MAKIKICGMTNATDARRAAALGADFIGLNFYKKSPRYVTPKEAKSIVESVVGALHGKKPAAGIVGVFVNEKLGTIKKISESCGLGLIQLSGDEDSAFVADVKKATGKKTIKAVRVQGSVGATKFDYGSDYLLLDSFRKGMYGGTGTPFTWKLPRTIDRSTLFLAGGLNGRNVAGAIAKLHPFAVDVCSGVESAPGRKDAGKMKRFIEVAQ